MAVVIDLPVLHLEDSIVMKGDERDRQAEDYYRPGQPNRLSPACLTVGQSMTSGLLCIFPFVYPHSILLDHFIRPFDVISSSAPPSLPALSLITAFFRCARSLSLSFASFQILPFSSLRHSFPLLFRASRAFILRYFRFYNTHCILFSI